MQAVRMRSAVVGHRKIPSQKKKSALVAGSRMTDRGERELAVAEAMPGRNKPLLLLFSVFVVVVDVLFMMLCTLCAR